MEIMKRILPVLGIILWFGAARTWAQEETPAETQYREDYERYQKIAAIKEPTKRADELLQFLKDRPDSKLNGTVQSGYLFIVQELANASKWDVVIAQSERFVRIRPKVGETYWFLGRAYSAQKKQDVAMIALAKCSLLKCPVSAKARQYLEYLYKGQRGNLVGLDKIIQQARGEIGGEH